MFIGSHFYSGVSFLAIMAVALITVFIFGAGLLWKFNIYGKGSREWMGDADETGVKNFLKSFAHSADAKPGIKNIVINGLLQKRLYNRSKYRWVMHMSIFWGFMALFILSIYLLLYEIITYYILGWPIDHFIAEKESLHVAIWGNLFGIILMIGLIIAVVNRFVGEPTKRLSSAYDWGPLVFLIIVNITGFLAAFAREEPFYGHFPEIFAGSWEFLGGAITSTEIALGHGVISLIFLAILPFTKFMHFFAVPLTQMANYGEEYKPRKAYGKKHEPET
ncbi:respiratory nitrate reductase subunit gamma [Methanonatronarchaeum sp. AMET-Sl]|uniref:respiratory nitrate reductase subunit gamma n=1 Tax=Methanonatronarchaeum sp. AMET-Sl TaxID=3037654 RepID=UPI00244D99C4|nr:respiratory nitrate reductase subunit gamma [Methanonatronarchaeum sp. AMET-Sl]WGI17833.1 respiratory nitrate reductase subunit gamma [Methanonatronarchaeum sp. AMET-Sl]